MSETKQNTKKEYVADFSSPNDVFLVISPKSEQEEDLDRYKNAVNSIQKLVLLSQQQTVKNKHSKELEAIPNQNLRDTASPWEIEYFFVDEQPKWTIRPFNRSVSSTECWSDWLDFIIESLIPSCLINGVVYYQGSELNDCLKIEYQDNERHESEEPNSEFLPPEDDEEEEEEEKEESDQEDDEEIVLPLKKKSVGPLAKALEEAKRRRQEEEKQVIEIPEDDDEEAKSTAKKIKSKPSLDLCN